ncbi:hypothetical protein KA119_02820 [Candidatus Gracilibacteria bacterium]|nr:hypothetical protein [Candidatus Gracilibacteria bacterium]
MRLHRSLNKAVSKVEPDAVAFLAEDYLDALRVYKRDVEGIKGLAGVVKIKDLVKKIDELEKEALKLEAKMDNVLLKRAVAAVKLKEELELDLELLRDYLPDDVLKEFPKI